MVDMAKIYSNEELALQIKKLSEQLSVLESKFIALEKLIVGLRFSITKET